MRESGSFAVFALVSLAFIPFMRRQNAIRRLADVGERLASAFFTGGLMSLPSARKLARPFSFNPPSGFFPSARCQAGDLGITVAQ